MDSQEYGVSTVSPGLLVSLVMSSHSLGSRSSLFVPQPQFQAFPVSTNGESLEL